MGPQATSKLQHTLNQLRTKNCGIAMLPPVTTFWPLAPGSTMHTKSWGGGLFGSCSLQQAELRLKLCIAALPDSAVAPTRHIARHNLSWICHIMPTGILNMYRCAFWMPSSLMEHHTSPSLIRPYRVNKLSRVWRADQSQNKGRPI